MNILKQYLEQVSPDQPFLFDYFKARDNIIKRFGYSVEIEPGRMDLLGWDLEYLCGAALANFIDQILVRRLNDFIPDNDQPLILDCGANIGFSVLHYKRQFPNARIIAFEPDPGFVPILRRNLDRNSAGDVEVVDAAVWINNGTTHWFCEGIDGSHITHGGEDASKVISVRTIDLAEYLTEPVDLIKMDIEGSEYEVIQHLANRLSNVKALSIECHINQETMILFSKMLAVLSAAGFNLSINSFGVWCDLLRQPPVDEFHYENYLLVSAWRGSIPLASTYVSMIPKVGVELTNLTDEFTARETNLLNEFTTRETNLVGYLKSYAVFGEKGLKRGTLTRPYQKENGFAWIAQLPNLKADADSQESPIHSSLLLSEDDQLLQPAHAMHDEIRNFGEGRYSHWGGYLYFSTSDGSDPNTNGREYRFIYIDAS